MKYRDLGRTGLQTSEIALGTWAFASQTYGSVSESDAIATIGAALDAGITFYDSAPLYGTAESAGTAETILGKSLASRRDEAIVATKFGRKSTDPSPNFHARRARESTEESLKRLNTDRIDVLFFHSPFSPDEIHDDVWGELGKLKDEGKVRFVGHSISMFEDTQQMARDWSAQRKIDVIQTVYSLLNRQSEQLINELGQGENIGFVARESLTNGFLSGRISRDTVFEDNNMNSRYSREEIEARVDQIERLGFLVRGDIKTMPQAAMRWVLDNENVSVVLTGAKNKEEVLDCAAASDAPSYTAEEMQRARELHTRDFAAA